MTQRHYVGTSDSCSIGSAAAAGQRHYCGYRAETALKITDYAGYTPHDLNSGLYTWVRLGGWWIGDSNGGGSGSVDHQTDTSYGSSTQRAQCVFRASCACVSVCLCLCCVVGFARSCALP